MLLVASKAGEHTASLRFNHGGGCRDAMAVFAMEAASVISERSLEISFASALSTVSASGLNINAGKPKKYLTSAVLCNVCVLWIIVTLSHSMCQWSRSLLWRDQQWGHDLLSPRLRLYL